MPTQKKAIKRVLAIVAVLGLGACAEAPPSALPETGGRALVLGPDPAFDPAALKDPWWRSPPDGPNRFVVTDLKGTLVLRIDAPAADQPTTTVVGRRLAVPLLAMPYLQWAWYLEPAIFGDGPGNGIDRGLRLTIGFYGGAPQSPQLTDSLFGNGPAGYPIHDRRVDIIFGGIGAPRAEDATQHMAAIDNKGIAYELRAQQFAQGGDWKLEALDLSKLYQQFWPHDRLNLARISFIAVGSLGGRPVAETGAVPLGYVAEIALTR